MLVAWEKPAGAGSNALKNRWLGHVAARGVASCLGKAYGRVWRVRGRANGRLERPEKQMAGHVAARGVASCLGKACGRVWRVRGRANGRLERPEKQMAGACGCERCCQLPGKGLRKGLEGSGAGKRQARTP